MNDDWRLRIDLHDEGRAHVLSGRLEALALEHDLRASFGDRIVRKLLAGRRYSFDTPAVWSKCGGGTIGAVLTFHIAPAKFAEDWPLSDYDPKSHTAYVQHVEYYAVGNVTQLDVSVDTNRRKVVGVDPTNSAPDAPDADQ